MKPITNPSPELLDRAKRIGDWLSTNIANSTYTMPPDIIGFTIMVHYSDTVVLEVHIAIGDATDATDATDSTTTAKRDHKVN